MRKGKSRNNGLLPNSLRIISSCLKTVSTNASTVASTVRSAGASVAASISTSTDDQKDQVTWASFDRLEQGPSAFKHVLLLGYQNGFQVFDVEDASNFRELVSKRDGPVSFLQMQPFPTKSDGHEGFRSSHPLLLVVAGDDSNILNAGQNHCPLGGLGREDNTDSQSGNYITPTSVRFYSFKSHSYVHVLRFRSAVRMVRCSPRILAVGLATQTYCIDALTLESKFSVLTYPVPQLAGQGTVGVNIGHGPMAVGPRWLAYASNNPLVSNSTRLSPKNLTPSPGVSPSTSPGGSSMVARYAMESSKQLAAGIINLGDMGYRTLSKYYQELLPDGSNSPVSSNSGWKVGRLGGSDMDNAGMVVVKDFVSRAVISQFKAHTSPISALRFDPSGTLLVTASIYGNNLNIFRIMPSFSRRGSGVQSYDWNSSHVHLYKLHRGITTAMIQDICFSHYSQWIAIVSSKGTCHIFTLSPFGADSRFQSLNSEDEDPSLYPVLSLPSRSTSSCKINQHSSPFQLPVSVSVVSRIKYSSFGWLNTVGSTGSAAGKVFVPSGAVAAVFHNSISQGIQHVNSKVNSLEHLLVYTPSGHVVQHELLPSIGLEPGESSSRTQPASFVHIQDDDLKVKVEPVQWWDVCRRSDWPEREECAFGSTGGKDAEIIQKTPGSEDHFRMKFLDTNDDASEKISAKTCFVKSHERSHWYLSNAEVNISSFRLPVWQKSKICFYMMDSRRVNNYGGGEFEIEKLPIHEVELKQKELLPVFDHFHSIKSGWNDRGLTVSRYNHSPSSEPHQAESKITQETVICHSTPASLSSTESSECGSSRRIEHLLDLDQINCEKTCIPTCQNLNDYNQERKVGTMIESGALKRNSLTIVSLPLDHPKNVNTQVINCARNGFPLSENYLSPTGTSFVREAPNLNANRNDDLAALTADSYNSHTNSLVGEFTVPTVDNPMDFGLSFVEGQCKALNLNECHRSAENIIDEVDSSSCHCEKEKPEEDGENDEFLGGMFFFSEEG